VKRLGVLAVFVAAFLAVTAPAPAKIQSKRNPFGVSVVRFSGGTSGADMRAAVAKAGGDVVTDLSEVGALAVAPVAADFTTRIRSNPRVTSVFAEPVFRSPVGRDLEDKAAPVWSPLFDSSTSPDPWHDASSFLGVSNPQGILQWEDARMNVAPAWERTLGDRTVRIAVVDTGVQGSHRELQSNFIGARNFIPCDTLTRDFGAETVKQFGLRDCSNGDKEGHGTWVASRIAGALNGFASNGVAPRVQIASYKVLSAGFGGMPDWILSGLIAACRDRVDLVNMSITGYLDPSDPSDAQTFLLFDDVVQWCRDRGVTILAAAGNEHVRVDRVNVTLGGRTLNGVGRVSSGPEGIATAFPGQSSIDDSDLRGALEAPAGVPGVVMVSATNNANGAAPADDPFGSGMHVGARDQLAYYSSYGSRIDIAAPGGARRFNLPGWDGGDGNFLYGGYGSLGALDASALVCDDPIRSSLFNFACFEVQGNGFGWLQGTSMAVPNAVGVAALAISAKAQLRGNPAALTSRLLSTARQTLTNYTGPNDPANTQPTFEGDPCNTGYCHLDTSRQIGFADAYGAGLVDAGAAVAP
jgi:subtilisin family serine protease